MHRLLCIFLLICLPLQGFAMQMGGGHTLVAIGLLHELEHEQAVAHHHEDDGSVHYDGSEESKDHVQQQCASPCQFLLPATATVSPTPLPQDGPPPSWATFIPDPDLEDPERPPVRAPGLTAGG